MTPTRLSVLLLAACLGASAQALAAQPQPPGTVPQAQNIIFFLGDGMGPPIVTATRIAKYGEDGLLNFEKLDRTARVKTYSANGQTTDSAASMGAYMTGRKINNEAVSMIDATAIPPGKDANGNPSIDRCGENNGKVVPTIAELAKAHGKAIGAVTTTDMTHATPAATLAHACDRHVYYQIAQQLVPGGAGYNAALGDGADVLMGGNRSHFTPFDAKTNPKGRPDNRDLLAELEARGYAVGRTKGDMQSAMPGRKYIGLYSADDALDYVYQRNLEQPTLAEMTSKAIELLSKNPNGFFLMVEGGKIDYALHDTQAKIAVDETIAFDEAIATALERMRALDPGLERTLIVVTSDHDHTMTFNGSAKRGNPPIDIVRGYADGQPARDADGKTYTTLVFGNGPNRPDRRENVDSATATAYGYHQETGVRTKSESHGGGDVKLYAVGAGSAPFKGTIENTRVFDLMKAAFGF